jgi:signal transduction histidine kinase
MTTAIEIADPLPTLPPSTEQGIYRVAQEALANVALHAGATRLQVTLAATDGIVLTVRDDGRGFDPALTAANGHFGLQGMRERAAMMGAVLEVESVAGGGTTVRLEVP